MLWKVPGTETSQVGPSKGDDGFWFAGHAEKKSARVDAFEGFITLDS